MKKSIFAAVLLCTAFVTFAQSASQLKKITESKDESVLTAQKTVFDGTKYADPRLAMSVADYPVTAGDVYTLGYAAGTTPVTYQIPVDTSYKLRIANLGVINASGMTYQTLKQQVEAIVQRNYPMGGVQFVITTPATFLVTVTGEVIKTEEKNAWALMRLSDLVNEVGTDYASKRKVTVISVNGNKYDYDLFKAEREGDMKQNPYLRPGDKVVINRIFKKVVLNGAVERPEEYELLENENLKDLVEYYGHGLTEYGDTSRIELSRIVEKDNETNRRMFYLGQKDYEENYRLENQDIITINSYENFMPVVFVEGAVYTAGSDAESSISNKLAMKFTENENYSFFFRRNADLYGNESDLENAYIIRGAQTIPVDISSYLYTDKECPDLFVQNYDRLIIPFKQFFITVAGAVNSPGRYPYIPDRTWDYYIALAGGFNTEKNSGSAIKIIDIDGNKLDKSSAITPETSITAKSNSFLYYFGRYAPVVTTILSVVSTTLTLYLATK